VKKSPATPPLNGVGMLCSLTLTLTLTLTAYRLQKLFFGEAEAPFLHQIKTLQLFVFMEVERSWSTQHLAFYPSQSLYMFKLCKLKSKAWAWSGVVVKALRY
jgi:hypothetical protein